MFMVEGWPLLFKMSLGVLLEMRPLLEVGPHSTSHIAVDCLYQVLQTVREGLVDVHLGDVVSFTQLQILSMGGTRYCGFGRFSGVYVSSPNSPTVCNQAFYGHRIVYFVFLVLSPLSATPSARCPQVIPFDQSPLNPNPYLNP